ncbi:MAG: hypothetical protein NUV57_04080 [archaeon]|nr:hypothetical protein [archaeon]
MKRIILILALLFLSLSVNAVEINQLTINIAVDNQGFANIVENYDLQFISPFEEADFANKTIENSSSLQAWQADYDFFYPRFAQNITEISPTPPIKISFNNEANRLTFEYSLRERFATLTSEEQRSDFFIINNKQLAIFLDTSIIVIPENNTVRINIPQNSEIDTSKLPEKAVVSGNTIILSGIRSNSISIEYRVMKPIAPTSGELIQGLSGIYVILAPILIVLLVFAYIKRNELEEKIETYLVKHSEMKTRKEEEIDVELD